MLFLGAGCASEPGGGGGGGGSSPAPETVSAEDPNGDSGTWTILIHFAVDNNIDYSFEKNYGILSNYLATLESVKAADTANRLKILILMDAYTSDVSGVGYISKYKSGYYCLTGGDFTNDIVVNLPDVNSGSTNDSKAFIDWVVANYPSDHYMYSVFNHGSGFADENIDGTYGIGFDDGSSDSLSHYELGKVTAYLKSKIGKNIDLFFAYACLMGGVELAYEIRSNANYLLCSEQSYPADKWSYEALNAILSSTKTSGLGIGKAFCSSAYNYFVFTQPRRFTLSLIDLSKIDLLYSTINDYAIAVTNFIGSDSLKASYFNDAVMNSFQMDYYYYIDLGDYLSKVAGDSRISSSVKDKANLAITALNNSVVCKRQNGCPAATGLTIFHNNWYKVNQYNPATYEAILSFGANTWFGYMSVMNTLIPAIPPDAYEDDNNYSQASTLVINGPVQNHSLHNSTDDDWVKFTLAAKAGVNIFINNNSPMLSVNGYEADFYVYYEGSLYYLDSLYGGYASISNTSTTNYTLYIDNYSYSGSTGVYSINATTGTPLLSTGEVAKIDKVFVISNQFKLK